MKTSKHTPGPWAMQATAGDHDFAVYNEQSGKDIALVRDFHEGNARLITSAPILLAALQRLMVECQSSRRHIVLSEDEGMACYNATAEAINQARAALTLATEAL